MPGCGAQENILKSSHKLTKAVHSYTACSTFTRTQGSTKERAGESAGPSHRRPAPPSSFIHHCYARKDTREREMHPAWQCDTDPVNNYNLILWQRVLNDSPNDFLCLIPSPLSDLIGKGILFQICFTPEVWTMRGATPGERKLWETAWPMDKHARRGGLQTGGEGTDRDIHLSIYLQK